MNTNSYKRMANSVYTSCCIEQAARTEHYILGYKLSHGNKGQCCSFASVPVPSCTYIPRTKPMNATEHQTLIEMSLFLFFHILALEYRLRKRNVITSENLQATLICATTLSYTIWVDLLKSEPSPRASSVRAFIGRGGATRSGTDVMIYHVRYITAVLQFEGMDWAYGHVTQCIIYSEVGSFIGYASAELVKV